MGFRIVVRMTKFFTDERAFSYIFINDTLKAVHNLESYLVDRFALTGYFCLMKENVLLPSCEDIHIVQADEMISVIPLSSPFSFMDKESGTVEEVPESNEKEAKKRKRKKNKDMSQEIVEADLGFTGKSSDKENISLNCTVELPKVVDNEEVFSAIKNIEEYHSKLKKKEEDEVETMKSKALSMLKDIFPTNGVSDGRIRKRKRTRVRKSKKSNQIEYLHSDSESNVTHANKPFVLTKTKINSHVRFNSTDNPVTILQNEIEINKNDKNPRIVRAIQPDMIAKLNNSHSPRVLPLEHSTDETDTNKNGKFSNFYNGDMNKISALDDTLKQNQENIQLSDVVKQLDVYPMQYTMSLKINDAIVFKILKMGDDYTPTISNYILGKVLSHDEETKQLKISILDGQQECNAPAGKFDLEDERFDKGSEITECIEVTWDQLLEPRLVQSS